MLTPAAGGLTTSTARLLNLSSYVVGFTYLVFCASGERLPSLALFLAFVAVGLKTERFLQNSDVCVFMTAAPALDTGHEGKNSNTFNSLSMPRLNV